MPKYYTINEETARRAKEANSYNDYVSGSATAEYKSMVDRAYTIAEDAKATVDPIYHDKIDYYLDLYARKLADNLNAGYIIDARVPSILIAGGSNFPVAKKEKQNRAREKNLSEYNQIKEILHKIRTIGHGGIMSDDQNAIEKLKKKLASLEASQATMKAANAYYRKHKTLDGCPDLTPSMIQQLKANMSREWHIYDAPFPPYELSNNNANIHRIRQRIDTLKKEKQAQQQDPAADQKFDGFSLVENGDICRIQFLFDGKPDEKTRSILKANGFRWAPSESAWQRLLNDNGRHAAREVIKAIG